MNTLIPNMAGSQICPVCQKNEIPQGKKYCSLACSHIAHEIEREIAYQEEKKQQAIKLANLVYTCPQCGREYHPKERKQKYCSLVCANTARNRKSQEANRKRKEREEAKKFEAVIESATRKMKDGMRHCHDCGKPTYNYRCSECWRKIRLKLGIAQEDTYEG